MEVWLSNLIQKNPVSGRSLLVKDNDEDKDTMDSIYLNKKEAAQIFVDEVLDYFNIIDKLKYRILPTQAVYGDAFVELINLKNNDLDKNELDDGFLGESSIHHTDISKSKTKTAADEVKVKHLLEMVNRNNFSIDNACEELSELFVNTSWDSKESILGESLVESLNKKDQTIVLKERKESKNLDSIECFFEYVQNNAGELKPFLKIKNKNPEEQPKKRGRPKKNSQEAEKKESFTTRMTKAGITQTELNLSNVLMLIHDPKKIVILHTEYGSILGYVEVSDKDEIQSTNINQQLNTIIGKIITSAANNGVHSQEEIIARVIRLVVRKIINNSSDKFNIDPDKVLNSLDPTVLNTIKKLIIETDKSNPRRAVFKKLKARFIPITNMFRFTSPNTEYFPYGRSFIDPLVLQSKLYILSQLSNTIMKLSRAAPIRKWIVDVGATQGQTKYIQQLKRDKLYLF